MNAWGAEGNTFEVHWHMRSFARLLLGNNWYRISDWTLWKVHFKFKKQTVWRDNGTFISMDNDDF
jgi:hypothetical protein